MTHQEKKERIQKNKIRNEREEITTDTKEIQMTVRKYYELYVNKLDNLNEMDKFLQTYNLPKLSQEEWENLNRQITPNEIEVVIKKTPKSPGQDGFTGNFHQTFQEELISPLLQLIYKILEQERLPNSFYDVSIILIHQKIKNGSAFCPSNPTSENVPKGTENTNLKEHKHPYIHYSIIYNCQDMEAAQVSISRWVDKTTMGHLCNGILLGHKKKRKEKRKFYPLQQYMDLDNIMLNDICQSEKDKYHTISLICAS